MIVRSWNDRARFQRVVVMDVYESPDPSTFQKVKIHGVYFVPWEDVMKQVTRYSAQIALDEWAIEKAAYADDTEAYASYILEGLAREIAREMLKKLLAESPEIAGKIARKSPEIRLEIADKNADQTARIVDSLITLANKRGK